MFPSGPLFEEIRALPPSSGDAFCDALRERLVAAYPGAAVQEARAAISALSEHSQPSEVVEEARWAVCSGVAGDLLAVNARLGPAGVVLVGDVSVVPHGQATPATFKEVPRPSLGDLPSGGTGPSWSLAHSGPS